jgi:hypothetical protein
VTVCEKSYVKSEDIKAVLDAGHRVWSGMLGRVGWIDEVYDYGGCKLRLGLHGFHHGVTRFDNGDQAEMIWDEKQDVYVIQHPESIWRGTSGDKHIDSWR